MKTPATIFAVVDVTKEPIPTLPTHGPLYHGCGIHSHQSVRTSKSSRRHTTTVVSLGRRHGMQPSSKMHPFHSGLVCGRREVASLPPLPWCQSIVSVRILSWILWSLDGRVCALKSCRRQHTRWCDNTDGRRWRDGNHSPKSRSIALQWRCHSLPPVSFVENSQVIMQEHAAVYRDAHTLQEGCVVSGWRRSWDTFTTEVSECHGYIKSLIENTDLPYGKPWNNKIWSPRVLASTLIHGTSHRKESRGACTQSGRFIFPIVWWCTLDETHRSVFWWETGLTKIEYWPVHSSTLDEEERQYYVKPLARVYERNFQKNK